MLLQFLSLNIIYLQLWQEHQNRQGYQRIDDHMEQDQTQILNDEDINLQRAYHLQQDHQFILFFCIIDGLMNLFYVMANPFLLFAMMGDIYGYYGARYFSKKLFFWFLIFQGLTIVSSLIIFILICACDPTALMIIGGSLMLGIRCYFMWRFYRFYRMLPIISPLEAIQQLAGDNMV